MNTKKPRAQHSLGLIATTIFVLGLSGVTMPVGAAPSSYKLESIVRVSGADSRSKWQVTIRYSDGTQEVRDYDTYAGREAVKQQADLDAQEVLAGTRTIRAKQQEQEKETKGPKDPPVKKDDGAKPRPCNPKLAQCPTP